MNKPRRSDVLAQIERRGDLVPGRSDMIWAESELKSLARHLRHPSEATPALCQLAPIRVVACIEGCLKAAASALINHGDPYRTNARRLFQEVRIDFDVLKALLDERVSLGEIVANSLGWYDMAEVNSRMTAMLGSDFFTGVRGAEDRWEIEIGRVPKRPIIDSLDKVLADIDDALTIRHVLCHETAILQSVPEADASRFLESGRQFTNAVSWLISETLYPNSPLTQTAMNIEAGRRASIAEAELDKELSALQARLDDEDKGLLRASQDAWVAYRRSFSELEGNAAKGGTMASMLYGKAAEAMTRHRILEIKESLRQEGLAGKPRRRRPAK